MDQACRFGTCSISVTGIHPYFMSVRRCCAKDAPRDLIRPSVCLLGRLFSIRDLRLHNVFVAGGSKIRGGDLPPYEVLFLSISSVEDPPVRHQVSKIHKRAPLCSIPLLSIIPASIAPSCACSVESSDPEPSASKRFLHERIENERWDIPPHQLMFLGLLP